MSNPNDLSRMVPGFEFLQTLIKGASAGLPGVQGFGQWVAPTLDPEELDKRIQELRTVQFWLEQNARLLAGTVQALEVQRMTLSTLQSMNLPLTELRDALQARPSAAPPAPEPAPAPYWVRPPKVTEPAVEEAPPPAAEPAPAPPAAAPAPAIDPMQWWGALTQQFTEIAAKALQEGSAEAASRLAAAAQAAAPAAEAEGAEAAKAPRARRQAAPAAAPPAQTRRPAPKAPAAQPASRKAAAPKPAGKASPPRPRKR